jgi:hypothetical protein
MGKIEQYRHLEETCMRLADQADSVPEKSALLRMAESWRRLAEQVEHPEDGRHGDD